MATRTLTALFDSYDRAAEAVRKLETAGIAHGDISIVSNDESHRQYHDTTDGTDHGGGTGTGASLGTLIGGGAGLLAGLGMLAIPGLGPVVAAGWLVSTLVGAGVGAAAGGLVGSLTDAGISQTDAHAYAEGVRRGGTLVTARVDDSLVGRATDILDVDGSVDIDERANTWRNEGWTGQYQYAGSEPTGVASATGYMPGAGTSSGAALGTSAGAALGTSTMGADMPGSTGGIGSVPVTDYGTTPRTGEADALAGRRRVRVYPLSSV